MQGGLSNRSDILLEKANRSLKQVQRRRKTDYGLHVCLSLAARKALQYTTVEHNVFD